MPIRSLQTILQYVQRRIHPIQSSVVTDAELLERFVQHQDEAAFELLMWRHGPLVYGVCRRILRQVEDAEDAFQATFLMLARKAGSIGRRESVSGWLYTVAYRIALRAKMRSNKRSHRELPLEDLTNAAPGSDPTDQAAWLELRRVLDAELSQIPEKYRTAFILCHLEGKTCEEAAAHLGVPRGTVQSRVGRARERLRARLSLRGWMPGPFSLPDVDASALAMVSPVLVNGTVNAALLVLLGKLMNATISPSAVALMNETLREMRLVKVRDTVLATVLTGLILAMLVVGIHSTPLPAALNGGSSPPKPATSSCNQGTTAAPQK
jgi:RNA polymerase sigma factor (sigma-70 family)